MAGKVKAIGQSHHGIKERRICSGRDSESPIQNNRFHDVIQKGNRKSGEEERIRESVPTHIVVPTKQRGATKAASAENGLKDVAQTGDSKPDESPTIRQKPPFLGQNKRQEGRNEPDHNLDRILDATVHVSPGDSCPGLRYFFIQIQLISTFLVQSSKRDDISWRFHPGVIVLDFPFLPSFYPQMFQSRQQIGETSEPFFHGSGNGIRNSGCSQINRHPNGKNEDLRSECMLNCSLGTPCQGFLDDQSHTVPMRGSPGGIAADVRSERDASVVRLKCRDVAENFCQLGTTIITVRPFRLFNTVAHLKNHPFQCNDIPFVDGHL